MFFWTEVKGKLAQSAAKAALLYKRGAIAKEQIRAIPKDLMQTKTAANIAVDRADGTAVLPCALRSVA
jgi:hypothetical protein